MTVYEREIGPGGGCEIVTQRQLQHSNAKITTLLSRTKKAFRVLSWYRCGQSNCIGYNTEQHCNATC